MESTYEILFQYVWVSLLAGLLGTGAMLLLTQLLGRSGLGKVRMITALGSLFTHSYENARRVGLYIHLVNGILFAALYTLALIAIDVSGAGPLLVFGGTFGFIHGMIAAIALVVAIAERHPLKEFQRVSYPIALAHVLGHVVFGLVVAAVVAASGIVAQTPVDQLF